MAHTDSPVSARPAGDSAQSRSPHTGRSRARTLMPGLLVTLAFAIAAFITWWFARGTVLKLNALMWAFVFSIVAGNIFPSMTRALFMPGIEFCSSRLLRISIGLLGLTISASVWMELGWAGVVAVLLNLAFVFAFGVLFCRYVLILKGALPILIGAGTGICGASAVAATGPAIRAKAEEMGLAVATITMFGLLAMFAYPFLFNGPLGPWLNNSPAAYGMWTGMGVHETAQVLAAGAEVDGGLAMAISAKFVRIFMIGPMMFVSLMVFRRSSRKGESGQVKMPLPWFAVAFIVLTLVNTGLQFSPAGAQWKVLDTTYLQPAVTFLMAWAFAGLGLRVKLATLRSVGWKAALGGMIVAVVAGVSALLLTKYLFLPFAGLP